MKEINSCPLKGGHFFENDLKILNNNKTCDNYVDKLKALRLKIKPTERAWLAGIIDGEGHVTIRSKGKRKDGTIKLGIKIAVESSTPIMQLKFVNLIDFGKIENLKPRNGNAHTTRYYIAKYSDALVFLDLIIPYLVVKKHIALFVREFCMRRIKNIKICEYDYILFEEVKEANRKKD